MWREVAEFPGYMVSDAGVVIGPRGWVLKQNADGNGYPKVSCRKDGKGYQVNTHRLVAQAFIEKPEGRLEVNHKNGVKADNRIENLEYAPC